MSTKKTPKWAEHFIKDSDLQNIAKAIGEAEQRTRGEIVPMIVRSSSVSHLSFWFGCLIWFSFLFLIEEFLPSEIFGLNKYLIFLILLGCGTMFLRTSWAYQKLYRALSHPADRHAQVLARAEIEFHRSRLDKTSEHSSILLFVSLLERDAVVLADTGVAERVPAEEWQKIINGLTEAIKKDRVAEGWISAIKHCGELLSEKFAAVSHGANEIPNEIIFKD